jgi:hypothetical protein
VEEEGSTWRRAFRIDRAISDQSRHRRETARGTIKVDTQPGAFTEIRIILPRAPAFV